MIDIQTIFNSAPGAYLVLKPDFEIVAVSDEYLNVTMKKRDKIVGVNIFEAFPANPDEENETGLAAVRFSLNRVLETNKPDEMEVQKYDIERPEAEGGGFEE